MLGFQVVFDIPVPWYHTIGMVVNYLCIDTIMVRIRVRTNRRYVHVYRTYVRTRVVRMSQLSDWKRAHLDMCTENHHVCVFWEDSSQPALACEGSGGDPRCRHRCRVGTVMSSS